MTTEGNLPSRLLIGRRERISFPEWGLSRIRAKVDTGAYSSALDARGCELLERDGQTIVRLRLVVQRRPSEREQVVEAPLVALVRVRSSSGKAEKRPLIEPTVRLGPITRRIRMTVTSRAAMRSRMLLGRQALAGLFLVDVSAKYLLDQDVP